MVADNGTPPLSSTTRIVVTVEDINDHSPEFDQKLYKVQIPSNAKVDQALFQVRIQFSLSLPFIKLDLSHFELYLKHLIDKVKGKLQKKKKNNNNVDYKSFILKAS